MEKEIVMPGRPSMKKGVSILLALHFGLLSSLPPAFAESEKPKDKVEKQVATESNSARSYPVGLDKKTLSLVNRGLWKDAAARLEKLGKDDKDFSRENAWLAFSYMFLNRSKDLKALAQRLQVSDDPHSKTYERVVEAFSKISANKSKEAAKILTSLPREYANDALVNFALAAVSGKNGKAGAAIEYCKRAVAIDPQFAWGYRTLGYLELRWLNRPQEAEEALARALEIEPRQDEVRNMLVRSMLGHNDFDGAIAIAREAIKLDKKSGDNHLRLATIYERQWRFIEATEELNKAIKINPENGVYFRRRAAIKQYQGDMDAAIHDQTKAVALSKDKAFELVALAKMNIAAGKVDPAIANLNEALERSPRSREAHRELANLLTREKRYDELVKEYRRALKEEEKNANLHYLLAEALMKAGKDKEALDQYKQTANLNNKDPRALRKLGTYYSEHKLYDKAIKAFRRALNINPTSVQDMVALGYCYAQDDNYLQSEAAFVTALALKQLNRQSNMVPPSRQDIIRTLASLLLMEGRYGEARNQFQSLYAMTRKSPAKNIDAYLLAQAAALASPVDSNIAKLEAAFKDMTEKEKSDYKYSFIQSLIKLKRQDQALKLLTEVDKTEFEKEPKWSILKARANREGGRFEIAEKIIKESISNSSKREETEPSLVADALVERARIKLAQKDLEAAGKLAADALSTYPKAYASYLVLAKVAFERGENQEVVSLLKKALEQNPYYVEAYLLTGDALFRDGDAKEALAFYKDAHKVRPEMLAVHEALLKGYKALDMESEAEKEAKQIEAMKNLK